MHANAMFTRDSSSAHLCTLTTAYSNYHLFSPYLVFFNPAFTHTDTPIFAHARQAFHHLPCSQHGFATTFFSSAISYFFVWPSPTYTRIHNTRQPIFSSPFPWLRSPPPFLTHLAAAYQKSIPLSIHSLIYFLLTSFTHLHTHEPHTLTHFLVQFLPPHTHL